MAPLLEAGLVQINARGHYSVPDHRKPAKKPEPIAEPARRPRKPVISDDYCPESADPEGHVVGGDYFPSLD